ncbi:MAG: universal stress protein [Gemmobacter sp.]|nr:universal stress protein [Gemmobacter sp.]
MDGKILVATDGSETGNRAVDAAAELSAKLGHDLCIVHVLMHGRATEDWMRMAEAEHLIEHVAQQTGRAVGRDPSSLGNYFARIEDDANAALVVRIVGDEIQARSKTRAIEIGACNVTTRSCVGDYADQILDAADAEKPTMIVLGSRGLGRTRGALLGSVSQKVLHHAKCTVVVVR